MRVHRVLRDLRTCISLATDRKASWMTRLWESCYVEANVKPKNGGSNET